MTIAELVHLNWRLRNVLTYLLTYLEQIAYRCRSVENGFRQSMVTGVQCSNVTFGSFGLFHLHHLQLLQVNNVLYNHCLSTCYFFIRLRIIYYYFIHLLCVYCKYII